MKFGLFDKKKSNSKNTTNQYTWKINPASHSPPAG